MAAALLLTGFSVSPGAAAEPASTTRADSAAPLGFGADTTGGAGGETVSVYNASGFIAAVQSTTARTVLVTAPVNISGTVDVGSNKTILGVGDAARINGGGLNVSGASNVIIQNVRFIGSSEVAINVQNSSDVWIDHNEISRAYKGGIDIKNGSDQVTVSWNRIYDQEGALLVGHDAENDAEDLGKLRVTFAHNWFDGTEERNLLVRFGNPVHVLNNFFSDIDSYGVRSTELAGVLIEGNHFENARTPYSVGGYFEFGSIEARDNKFTGSGSGETGGTVADVPYDYTVESPETVKATVTAGAGIGRI
ncbi:polysaccharide lyase family 1 protein [Streptomyces parvulus]|nr:right-handed parallel beta-helix repeat-containing protein [Streptomyces parvulus]